MNSVEKTILGRILVLQSALQATPDNQRLGELVCYALSDIPGVKATAIYLEGTLVAEAGGHPGDAFAWPRDWQETVKSFPSLPETCVTLALQTASKTYGYLALLLTEQHKFQGYRPHLENTANLIALRLENRQQAAELQELNRDLEAQVKQRVRQLQRSEERLSMALKGAKSGIWDWNLKSGEIFFSPDYFTLAGYEPDEFPHAYEEWKVRVHPEDIESAEARIEDYLAGRTHQFVVEFRFKTKQDGWMWILGQGIISERDASGAPLRVTGTHTDIDERKQAESELLRNQYYLKKAQEIGKIGTWELDLLSNRLVWTDENCRIFGVPPGTIANYKLFLDKVHPDDLDYVDREWQAALQGKPYDIEHRIVVAGKTKWVREKADLSFDAEGKPVSAIGFTQDISASKLTESALRESEARFRMIFESNPVPVFLARLEDGAFLNINKAFETTTGFAWHEVIGHNWNDLGLWAEGDGQVPFQEQLQREDELSNFAIDFCLSNGETRAGLLSARLIRVSDMCFILAALRDVTAEKAVAKALHDMDKMKNEFISTAAHELNTPLSAMMGFTEFLRNPDQFGGFSEAQKQDFLNEIYDRGEELSRIIDDLLDISRIESGQPFMLHLQETNFMEVLVKIVKRYQQHDKSHIFRYELPKKPENSMLHIDRMRIHQVLENLLSNAAKYSPEGEEIVVRGKPCAGGWETQIEDHGIGMTPEQINRVFDKFYRADTSNTAIGGLGLGISIAKQIIENHGGHIRIESVKGKGSKVTFDLPYTNH